MKREETLFFQIHAEFPSIFDYLALAVYATAFRTIFPYCPMKQRKQGKIIRMRAKEFRAAFTCKGWHGYVFLHVSYVDSDVCLGAWYVRAQDGVTVRTE